MMLAPAMSKVREFLGSWKNLLALGSLPILGAWIYSRVWMVNPAILGDEYIYSINARHTGIWGEPIAGDFSNYLFNFVFSSTVLCGDNFYQCAKLINLAFFLAFVYTLFIVAQRYLPFWLAYIYLVLAALSPLSVYVSMFLPESMYFFTIGLVLLFGIRAGETNSPRDWFRVGLAIGVASLVKPHAWLSAVAFAIFFLVINSSKSGSFGSVSRSASFAVLGALISRIGFGFLIAGPQALNFFGQYISSSVIERLGSSGADDRSQASGPIGAGPTDAMSLLFLPQLEIHILTAVSIMGISLVILAGANISMLTSKTLPRSTSLALLATIWFLTMVIEIVLFTGWVTGNGDDHTTRVLLRYYEFLYLIVPLGALCWSWESRQSLKNKALTRWVLSALFAVALTAAVTGLFGSLTIQIADAPSLAGLVVNQTLYNTIATATVLGLLVYATFPTFVTWGLVLSMTLTTAGLGWQIQDQYQGFRGKLESADVAGKYLNQNLTEAELAQTLVVSDTRFKATLAALWADSPALRYELYFTGSPLSLDEFGLEGTKFVVVLGDFNLAPGEHRKLDSPDGVSIYEITR